MCKLGGIEYYVDVVSETKGKFFCFHKWHIDKTAGVVQYRRCLKCCKKQILQSGTAYQKIDIDYLKYERC